MRVTSGEGHISPSSLRGSKAYPRKFVKFDVQIYKFLCILTDIKSLILADDWEYLENKAGLPKIFLFLTGFVHISRVSPGQVGEGVDPQCSRIRILCFFSDFKKHDFLRFFEIMHQKVVKCR